MQPHIDDPHAVLGVPRGASRRQIAAAYRRLAKRHHPDVDSDPDAADRMRRINAAWRRLSGPGTPGRDATPTTSAAHWTTGRSTFPRRAARTRESWATWDSRTAGYHAFDRQATIPRRIRDPLRTQRSAPEERFQDTGWAALLAVGVMLVVLFTAAYAGSLSSSHIA